MISSLRSRLWLSYAFLVFVTLLVVAVGLFFAFQRSPLLYRQEMTRMWGQAANLTPGLESAIQKQPAELQAYLQEQAQKTKMRLAVFNQDGSLVAASNSGRVARIASRLVTNKVSGETLPVPGVSRDVEGVWLYLFHPLDQEHFLLVMAPRPSLPLRLLLRDEVFGPILYASLVALLGALILSLIMGQWIAAPLQRMAALAPKVVGGAVPKMPQEGPVEVRHLGQALNEMAQKVQESQESQHEFIANVSHELKTPITSIQGFAQAILDGTVQETQALKQAAGVIYEESTRMHRLVTELMALARLEAGTGDLRKEAIDINSLLGRVIEQLTPQAQKNGIVLEKQLTEIPMIVGDGDRLVQVFTNLVENGIKYNQPGGRVWVRSGSVNSQVRIDVGDTGIGIQPEDQKRIFERFYQVDKSRRGGANRGVGLGLAITRQIVLGHQGEIFVESQPGQGSVFSILLPVVRPEDATISRKKQKQ